MTQAAAELPHAPFERPAANRGRMPVEAPPLGADGDASADVLSFLERRYSVGPKYLSWPAPSIDQLRQAVRIALRAPDHRRLRPFRFVQVGSEQREALGRLFAADAAQRGHGAAEVERARERARNGPALLALIADIRPDANDVPAHEQWICVGAGAMSFLTALHLMGYGAKLLSGASVRAARIQAAFCRPCETLVAWVLAGTPVRRPTAKTVDDESGLVISDWHSVSVGPQ